MPQLFFVPNLDDQSDYCDLSEERSHYICRVMRLETGAKIMAFDGAGKIFSATIKSAHPKQAKLSVDALLSSEERNKNEIAIGLSFIKGGAMDRAIAQATELGAQRIILLESERSNVSLKKERMDKKVEHLKKVAISSCEQSGRSIVPKISRPHSVPEIIEVTKQDFSWRAFLDPRGTPFPNKVALQRRLVIIGPEGGFSKQESNALSEAGVKGLRLGSRTFRAENMPAVSLTALQQASGWV
jgi:16S rRNA (uracil1498-N3)-methyltransferase